MVQLRAHCFGYQRLKCSLCALFTDTARICTHSEWGMTDFLSIARSKAGQAWLSASFGSINPCHVNFSGHQPMPQSIILNTSAKLLSSSCCKLPAPGNEMICSDILLIAFVAFPPDRQIWIHSLNNQIYCTEGFISCLYLPSSLQGGQITFLTTLLAGNFSPASTCLCFTSCEFCLFPQTSPGIPSLPKLADFALGNPFLFFPIDCLR